MEANEEEAGSEQVRGGGASPEEEAKTSGDGVLPLISHITELKTPPLPESY